MKSSQILLVMGSAALFAWTVPELPDAGKGAGNDLAAADARPRTDNSSIHSWNAGQTVLKREQDGHFYANVGAEGSQYRFLVDTGASIVALTGADADAMGLTWDENSIRQIGRGASGPVYGVPVTIPQLEVGGYEARQVEAAIVPEGLGISLLGQSFLTRIENVQIVGDEMRLGG